MRQSGEDSYDRIVFPQPDFKIAMQGGKAATLLDGDPMLHEELEIKLFYDGSVTLMIDSDLLMPQPGDIIFVNPYELHGTVNVGTQQGKYHLLNLSLDFFTEQNPNGLDLRHLLLGKGICFHNHIRGNERLQHLLLQAVEELRTQPENYRMMVQCLMTEFFLLLLREEVDGEKSAQEPSRDIRFFCQLEPALQMIRQNYSKRITLEEMAAACGMSKCHFCRIFVRCTNQTAMQYLTEYRLKIANHLLSHTRKTLSQVAVECGFSEQGYFSRCYKKMYGLPPNQHRKSILDNQ